MTYNNNLATAYKLINVEGNLLVSNITEKGIDRFIVFSPDSKIGTRSVFQSKKTGYLQKDSLHYSRLANSVLLVDGLEYSITPTVIKEDYNYRIKYNYYREKIDLNFNEGDVVFKAELI